MRTSTTDATNRKYIQLITKRSFFETVRIVIQRKQKKVFDREYEKQKTENQKSVYRRCFSFKTPENKTAYFSERTIVFCEEGAHFYH